MLNAKFGEDAGKVWNALCEGELSVKALKKSTKLTDKDLYAAMGWLAREAKISFREEGADIIVNLI